MSKTVKLEERDEDGYWICLANGYQCGDDPGSHTIVENTKKRAHDRLTTVVRCFCLQCADAPNVT